ncbi:MAG: multicopper oxidase domain-containing protein [Desulfuromonadales bacterium]|nr:multicopper oxidase domain-containing protein [Desulfuromonadales bacterium]
MTMKRRDFLKLGASAGVATIIMGSRIPFLGTKNAFAATQTLEVTITDCMKQMVTHNEINDARCYFWIYKMKADGVDIPPECPGPTIYAIKGDSITIKITNALDQPHSFFIPGALPSDPVIFDSGTIPAGGTVGPVTFTVNQSGAHLYYDNLNAPVNRTMGLHGALVVRPAVALTGHNYTPYDVTPANFNNGTGPTAHVQNLFDMFGTPFWPGLKWEQGDPNTNCPPFRQYVWLYHMASPNLQAEVGALPAGQQMDPKVFMDKIARGTFSPTRNNGLPQYFTVNGQSGFFSHFDPAITPMGRVGEPVVIHCLNAGVQGISHHTHCNHFFITSINGEPNPNPIWVDIYGHRPMDKIDYTFPFMRPPDNANIRGIGRPDQPLRTATGAFCWPPQQEMQTFFPREGTKALAFDGVTQVEMGQRLSPLCYPAHDHLESSQTAQGGNYNCGLITGFYITGDRNAQSQGLGNFMNFPMDGDFRQMFRDIRGLAVGGVNATREATGPRTVAG